MADQTKSNGGDKPTVTFNYLKSPQFRTVFATGMIGAITPDGHIHFSLFSERPAIPRQIVHRLTEQGTLGEEISELRVSREGFVREMEVDVLMTVETAKSFIAWLQEKVDLAENRKKV